MRQGRVRPSRAGSMPMASKAAWRAAPSATRLATEPPLLYRPFMPGGRSHSSASHWSDSSSRKLKAVRPSRWGAATAPARVANAPTEVAPVVMKAVEPGAPAVRLAHRIRMLELEVAVEIAADLREPSAEVSAFRAVTDVHGPPPSVPIGCPARAYASTCAPSARKAMVRGAPAISTPSARSVGVMPLALAQAGHSQILPPLARYAAIRSASGS